MAWNYDVKKKSFYLNGVFQFKALYAGATGYKDDSKYECLKEKGALPRGKYRITGVPFTHKKAGPFTLRLQAFSGNNMCGRDGFLIHGDSVKFPGTASNGCIIARKQHRSFIWDSNDKEIIVT